MSKIRLDRIKAHIDRLEDRQPRMKPYGGGNPYSYCVDCERSNVQGHAEDCDFFETKRLVEDLKELVKRAENE